MKALPCIWNGEVLVPVRGYQRQADASLVIGTRYTVEVEEPRNMAQHKGYFARIHEAWQSMPEELLEDYPSSEHLRKRALIKTGYASMTDFVCASSVQAVAAARAFTGADKYALVEISDRAVRIWQAESQSLRAMGSQRFKRSIDEVERWIGDLLEIPPEVMARVA